MQKFFMISVGICLFLLNCNLSSTFAQKKNESRKNSVFVVRVVDPGAITTVADPLWIIKLNTDGKIIGWDWHRIEITDEDFRTFQPHATERSLYLYLQSPKSISSHTLFQAIRRIEKNSPNKGIT